MPSIREKHPPPYTIERIPAPGYRVVSGNGVPLIYAYAARKGLPGPQLSDAEALAVVKAFVRMAESSQ